MEDKIWNLLVDYGMNEKAADQCVKELLVLCNVVGQSEQLPKEEFESEDEYWDWYRSEQMKAKDK